MYDGVVIGAGPAGLQAARQLATRGLRVAVLEEHQVVGDPVHCTGVLAREAFDEFRLSTESILNELTTARFFSPSGQDIVYRTRVVEAVVVDRALFDGSLADEAVRAGAELIRGARVSRITATADGVTIHVAGQPLLHARSCVLACGDIAPDWTLGIGMGLGGLAGAYVGARLQSRLPETLLRRGLGVLALALGVRYAVQVITGG